MWLSVQPALGRGGGAAFLRLFLAADRVVLPGVGAYADCRAGLDAVPGMVDALNEAVVDKGRPFFGICVGMQLMSTRGLEKTVTNGFAGSRAMSSR
jgi:imidazoleglycerol phosphate synthase glutamine amidotransferase subunit HisH